MARVCILLLGLISYGIVSNGFALQDSPLSMGHAIDQIETLVGKLQNGRVKRSEDRGVTNLDIRDAILQLLNVIRENSKKSEKSSKSQQELISEILNKIKSDSGSSSGSSGIDIGVDQKIDNISRFLLKMNSKLSIMERQMSRGRSSNDDALETLAKDSYNILALLPNFISNTKEEVEKISLESQAHFEELEALLVDANDEKSEKRSFAKVLRDTETNILGASNSLKDIVIESGHMAESLFERVNDGYKELTNEIKGLSNVEQVLLDTADSVMDTKRKVEFGVQQIIFKVEELVKMSGGEIDEQMKNQFADVEKEIGQVWRQMGIMYKQVSNSITILEKVKNTTEGYVGNPSGSKLGAMEGQVEGLTDRMGDVDSNLNYMLGQLSLVVQEFNQVKTGLSAAMTGLETDLEDIKEYKPPQED
ncbi:hypothetical protein TCAL_10032 [Tigriopus californicus]|uniref:Uncharacterized protein n=1 Tax=Tigriopus californicus TaxID=6832 RepID=A0A553PNE8_TIGCA|nr:hypothetical protein TCAL_10032 [Tigriopus californicus]